MITPAEAKQLLRGVVVPLITVFRGEDRVLDEEATAANVQWIIDQGARQGNTVFLAAGSGGDFPMMNLDERKRVIRAVCSTAAGKVPVIASAQSTDIRDVIELCQWCEQHGVVGVQISGAYYYDGRAQDVIAWLEEVARHTEVGFLIYNNWYTGYNMPLDLIERLLDIPNSIGIKWSSPDSDTFANGVRRFQERVAVIDNNMSVTSFNPTAHMLGSRAFVSQLLHFYPERIWRVWELMEARRYMEAQQLYDEFMVPYLEFIHTVEGLTAGEGVAVRAVMEMFGLPAGVSRPPSRDSAITPEIRESFASVLGRFGVRS